VTLTGGDVGFAPEREFSGFSFRSDLALGAISETAPSSLFMLGKANLYLLGANTYTGRTELLSGTTWLGAAGALPATTSLVLSGGKLNFENRGGGGVSFNQTVASLSGVADTLITNTSADAVRNFTINQSGNTVFAGSIQGGLNVIKNGAGRLTLTDTNFPAGLFAVAGGELALSGVDAKVTGSLAVQNGGTLMGDGSVGMMTVANGGRLEPGMGVGTFTVGLLTLEAGASLQFEIQGANATGLDHIEVQGTLALNGLVNLELELGFQPTFGNKFDLITNFDAGAIGGGGRFVYNGNVLENLEQFAVSDGGFEQMFEIRYDASVNDAINNDVIITAVPEPTSTVFLLAGVAVCVRRRRK
jgi:autotransporter-associated beta strand protein